MGLTKRIDDLERAAGQEVVFVWGSGRPLADVRAEVDAAELRGAFVYVCRWGDDPDCEPDGPNVIHLSCGDGQDRQEGQAWPV